MFISEKNENVWWYDGERISFRTPNFISAIEQRIVYIKEDKSQLKKWILEELNQPVIWKDIDLMSERYDNCIYKHIANKDAEALIVEAQNRVYGSRWRRRAKKVLMKAIDLLTI